MTTETSKRTWMVAIIGVILVAFGMMFAGTALASVQSKGGEPNGEPLVCVGQHYSLKGNSKIGKDETPVFPADYWQANTKQEPHKSDNVTWIGTVGMGLHYTSAGSSGKRDWFYYSEVCETPPPSPTPTEPTPTETPSETATPTATPTGSATPEGTPTATPSVTPSVTPSETPSAPNVTPSTPVATPSETETAVIVPPATKTPTYKKPKKKDYESASATPAVTKLAKTGAWDDNTTLAATLAALAVASGITLMFVARRRGAHE